MSITLLIGDCRERLRELPDASVHCCVTSPPYFGLRDYGTADWSGGDNDCSHEPPQTWIDHNFNANSAFGEGAKTQGAAAKGRWYQPDGSCRCGATRIDRQLGLEPTPDEYVAGMVEVFREVRRVLRDDGTLWLNIGDSYAGSGKGPSNSLQSIASQLNRGLGQISGSQAPTEWMKVPVGCKPKDLIGIPWLLAFALRADGWYLRQEIIWAKPNPMPESVRDRCTKAHEQIFLLSKNPRYFFDAEAVAEPVSQATIDRDKYGFSGAFKGQFRGSPDERRWQDGRPINEPQFGASGNRNKRSVWTVATQPFSEAHFATYPPALIEPCILAGCPERCCAKCGAPWVPQYDRGVDEMPKLEPSALDRYGNGKHGVHRKTGGQYQKWLNENPKQLRGTEPSCVCADGMVAATVLDPFAGAGTTGLVADRLNRNAILIELNPEYAALAERRMTDDAPLFADVRAA